MLLFFLPVDDMKLYANTNELKLDHFILFNQHYYIDINYLGIRKQLASFFIEYGPRLLFLWEGRSGGAPEDLRFFPTLISINIHYLKTSNHIENLMGFIMPHT